MTSLNIDGELWTVESVQETCEEIVGPLCCWWVDCWFG